MQMKKPLPWSDERKAAASATARALAAERRANPNARLDALKGELELRQWLESIAKDFDTRGRDHIAAIVRRSIEHNVRAWKKSRRTLGQSSPPK